ncbi:MAG: proton-conducting transporter membrane subunit [Candidatus Omnitrophota bacterium]|nr:proton-conducting transporter membrane subunit [Candidatus Omnitrophota bacterium]
MTSNTVLLPILIPIIGAVLTLVTPNKILHRRGVNTAAVGSIIALIATAATLLTATTLFNKNIAFSVPWAGFGFEFSLKCYKFSSFIMLAAAFFGFLIALYSNAFLKDKNYAKSFYAYFLITLSFVNGTVLADNLVLLLFFWEGLLATLFLMIAIGNPNAFKTATKAFVIVGLSDLCFMVGAALAGKMAGTYSISQMHISLAGLGGLAFIFLMIGTIAKAGSMPFHTWIPDAAIDAPLPFMAFLPAAIEKLVGIYFLTRLSLDMFKLEPHSWVSTLMMSVGAITIILAVAMALIQKDFKRLLSYHAISQVGYMILGIGTLVPAGIIGGLFHMLNNSLYKCCLFLTGGAVEKQTGTTDLNKLGGLWNKMPVTFACFVIAAVSISGVPPFNGFFSKELVYDAALERGMVFYLAAVGGSFLTAASFLKLGHAAFIDKQRTKLEATKEAPLSMLVPMVVIALICVVFGLWNSLPINGLIQPSVSEHWLEGKTFAGFPTNIMLVVVTIVVLIAALLNHIYGVKKSGSGLRAADHIYHAPVLSNIYGKAEKRFFDPYDIGLKFVSVVSKVTWGMDKAIDWVYNDFSVKVSYGVSFMVRKVQNGNYVRYIILAVSGAVLVVVFLIKGAG